MATIEDWPEASEFPYIALIRIRYEYQIDSVVAGVLQRSVARLLPAEHALSFAKAINTGVSRVVATSAGGPQPAERNLTDLARVLDDFDELCPRPRRPRPHFTGIDVAVSATDPQPQPWRQAGAAEAAAAVLAGLTLIRDAGSELLQKELEPVLQGTLQTLAG
jgi:hypothetical protein